MLIFYTVKPGDSLFSLAEMFDTTVSELKRLNTLQQDGIEAGSRLLIKKDEKLHPFLANNTLMTDDLTKAQLDELLKEFTADEQPPKPPAEEPQRPDCIEHRVEQGDTLYSIALKHGTTPLILQRSNNITEPRNLQIGSTICVPRVPENTYIYTVRVGDTPQKVAVKFGIGIDRLLKSNYLSQDEKLLPGSQLLITV